MHRRCEAAALDLTCDLLVQRCIERSDALRLELDHALGCAHLLGKEHGVAADVAFFLQLALYLQCLTLGR
jgi:hypothetical protein